MINTTATNKKVREIVTMVRSGALIPRPDFQRRLVWTSKDKDLFIDTILRGFPFPEIYWANGDVDTETGAGTQLLVDGLQRVSTLVEYFSGDPAFSPNLSKPYKMLSDQDKTKFLEYSVVVRDLGSIQGDEIVEVFRRLNSTQYTLKDMEINNAVYNGALKRFCEEIAEDEFFEEHRIFTSNDRRRMGDVSFCLTLIGTMMVGYFNRDTEHENLLSSFNETFPDEEFYRDKILEVFRFIDECGFRYESRIWKKADLLTAFIEINNYMHSSPDPLEPFAVLESLSEFYERVDMNDGEVPSIYYKAALQASNDRSNRLRRAIIVNGVLSGRPDSETLNALEILGLIKTE